MQNDITDAALRDQAEHFFFSANGSVELGNILIALRDAARRKQAEQDVAFISQWSGMERSHKDRLIAAIRQNINNAS